MKRTLKILLTPLFLLIAASIISSCDYDDAWDEIPTPISEFLAQYFPGQGVSNFGESKDIYHVKMRNGAAISFDSGYSWISVNGYGGTLPEVFLFDELPPALYEYIQGLNSLDKVYSVTRDARQYSVALLNTSLVYNIRTDRVTEVNSQTNP